MQRSPLLLVALVAAFLALPSRALRATSQAGLLQQAAAESHEEGEEEAGKPDPGPLHTIEFDTDEGTWMYLDVSPDGQSIVFDLLGDIYTVPIDGGDATLLLGGRDWDHMPRYSPDGGVIAFISDRDGNMNLWTMKSDGSDLKQHTTEDTLPTSSPLWGPDGTLIVRKTTRTPDKGRSTELWMVYPDGGSGFRIPVEGPIAGPAISPDGRFIYSATQSFSSVGGATSGLHRFDRVTGDSVDLGAGTRPKISPDGRLLAYARDNDHLTALHLRDLRTGADRRLVDSITPMANGFINQDILPDYAFAPDSRSIIITIDGKIARVDVATGATREIPFRAHVSQQLAEPIRVDRHVAGGDLALKMLRWPSLSTDGSTVAFSAIGELYAADVASGQARRLTDAGEREYTPVFSPDGRWIAYTTWSDLGLGHVMVVPAAGGSPRRVTTTPGRYANPAWSRDGAKLAFVRGSGVEQRRQQPESDRYMELAWVPMSGGAPVAGSLPALITTTLPSRRVGFPMRFYPVIAFNPDGSRIFYPEWNRESGSLRTTLYSVRLDGTDKKGHLRFVAFDEVVPSPDGTHVAYVRREQVWVSALPQYPTAVVDLDFDTPSIPLEKLTENGGNYVGWQDADTLVWTFTNRIYRQPLAAEEPEQIVEIDLSVPRAAPTGRVAFTNARIITMKGDEVIESGTIVVDGDRIEAVGPASGLRVPEDTLVIDATGKTIMPGLVDVHAHLHYSAFELFPERKWEYIANLAYGVTSSFDPSAHNLDAFAQSELVEAGKMLGPRIFSTGDVIYGDESVFPVVYESIRSLDDAREVVRRYLAYDPEMLKEYMQPRRDQRQWLAQAAREEGVMLTAEGGGDLVLDLTMVADGYSAFEHSLPIAPLHRDVIEFVARSKVHYTPTLIVSYGGPTAEQYFVSRMDIHDDAKLRRFTPESKLDRWRYWRHIPDTEWYFMRISEAGAAITRAGGNVSLGAHGNRQGLGAHWELWGLQMGGLTNHQALRAGTWVPAVKLGYERDIGSLEPGKLADLLVLHANPLEDIRNSAKILWVMKNGFVWDAESMTRIYPDLCPLPRFFWQTQEDLDVFAAPAPQALGAADRSGGSGDS